MLSCAYWFLALSGGLFILTVFIVGEIADFGHDVADGIGSHLEGFLEGAIHGITGHFVDLHIGGGHHVDVRNGPSPFSFRTLIMFTTGFGAGGLLGYALGFSDLLTLVPAFGVGVVMGIVAYFFLRWLYNSQGSSDTSQSDYIGLFGSVITSIPEGGLGQVAVTVKLQRKNVSAKSSDGKSIALRTKVFIVQADEGGVFIVKRA